MVVDPKAELVEAKSWWLEDCRDGEDNAAEVDTEDRLYTVAAAREEAAGCSSEADESWEESKERFDREGDWERRADEEPRAGL